MTEGQARELLTGAFIAGWTAAAPEVPFAVENEVLLPPTTDSLALLTVQLTTAGQMTQGAPGTRREVTRGWVSVKLWTPANVGMVAPAAPDGRGKRAADLAGIVRSIFRMADLPSPVSGDEPLHVLSPRTDTIGTDGRWYMSLVRAPFWYVETV